MTAHQDQPNLAVETPDQRRERLYGCVVGLDPTWCLTHFEPFGSMDHFLATRPVEDKGHNPKTGIAYND